jgi:hypothetical protein
MKTIFVNTGLDDYLAEKIDKGQIHSNVQERLPRKKVTAKTLYRELEKGQSFLSGFSLPDQQMEELKKAITIITRVIEDEKNKNRQAVVTEEELIAALDTLDEIARGQRR